MYTRTHIYKAPKHLFFDRIELHSLGIEKIQQKGDNIAFIIGELLRYLACFRSTK